MAILTKAETASRHATVTWQRRPNGPSITISAGTLIDTIMATTYWVTDNPIFRNRGGGEADRVTMTDTIYYGTIGEPSYTTAGGVMPATGYHSYTNGLLGLLIHEASHMTQIGYDFLQRSAFVAQRDPQVNARLNDSDDPGAKKYSDNVEALINYLSREIAPHLSTSLPDFFPGTDAQPVLPEDIYEQSTGVPFSE